MRWALEGVISLSGALSSELNISLLLRMCIFAFLGLWRHATQALELKRSIPTRKRRLFPTLSWCSLRSFSMASSAFRFAVSSSVLFFSRMLRSLLRDVIYEHTKRITIGFSRDGWSRKTFHNLIQSALYRRDKVSWCPLKPKDFFGEGSASTCVRETLGDAYKMWHPLLRWWPESTHWSGFIHAPTKRKRDKRG